MSGLVKHLSREFTTISNHFLNLNTISFKAKGLWAFIASKPDGWNFAIDRIALQTSEGVKSIRSGITELEEAGYLVRQKIVKGQGTGRMLYHLFEVPTFCLEPYKETQEDIPQLKRVVYNKNSNMPFCNIAKRHIGETAPIRKTINKEIKIKGEEPPILPTNQPPEDHLASVAVNEIDANCSGFYPEKRTAMSLSLARKLKGSEVTEDALIRAIDSLCESGKVPTVNAIITRAKKLSYRPTAPKPEKERTRNRPTIDLSRL